jgi:hypothetical protein
VKRGVEGVGRTASSAIVAAVITCAALPAYAAPAPFPDAGRWQDVRLDKYIAPDAKILEIPPGGKITVGSPPLNYDLVQRIRRARYCAVGVVTAVRYECVIRARKGAQSLAIVELKIEETYWGGEARHIVIETLVHREECPIEYTRPLRPGFDLGDSCIVAIVGLPDPSNLLTDGLYLIRGRSVEAENGQTWDRGEIEEVMSSEAERRVVSSPDPSRVFRLKR